MKPLLTIPILTAIIIACNTTTEQNERVVTDLVGRELILAKELTYQIINERIEVDMQSPEFKIINYVDSSGCTSCRMKLQSWNELINEFKSIPDVDLEFITIVETTTPRDIEFLLKHDDYRHLTVLDSTGIFRSSNKLPAKAEYHVFLIDSDNHILALGNPVINPKIKKLYKQIIKASIDDDSIELHGNCTSHFLGIVDKKQNMSFVVPIVNHDTISLNIQATIPSCNCMKTYPNDNSIHPESNNLINVSFQTDSMSGYFSQYVDIFYEEKDVPDRITIYGYIR